MSLRGVFAGVALTGAVAFGLQHLDDLDRQHPAFSGDPAAQCGGGRAGAPGSGSFGEWRGVRWVPTHVSGRACPKYDHK